MYRPGKLNSLECSATEAAYSVLCRRMTGAAGIKRHLVPIPTTLPRRFYGSKGNYVNPVRVFACEAQPIVLEGLARVLDSDSEFEYLGSTPGIADALDAVREKHPDVLLVDQSAGLKQIFQFVSDVKSTWPRCQPILWVNDLAEIDCL